MKHRNKPSTLEFCGVYERNKKQPRGTAQRRAPFKKVCIIKGGAKNGISGRRKLYHTDTGTVLPVVVPGTTSHTVRLSKT